MGILYYIDENTTGKSVSISTPNLILLQAEEFEKGGRRHILIEILILHHIEERE